jgi:hypothetical protein
VRAIEERQLAVSSFRVEQGKGGKDRYVMMARWIDNGSKVRSMICVPANRQF